MAAHTQHGDIHAAALVDFPAAAATYSRR